MNELLEPRLAPTLAHLGRFWLWKRKELVKNVQKHIKTADAHTVRLMVHRNAIEAERSKVSAELSQLQSAHQILSTAHGQLQSDHGVLSQRWVESNAAHAALSAAHDRQRAELERLESAHAELNAAHAQLQSAHAAQTQRLTSRDAEYQGLSAAHTQLRSEAAELRQESERQLSQLQQCIAHLAALQNTHVQLQSTHQSLATEHVSLQDTNAQLHETHNQLQSAHASLTQRLTSRDAEYQGLSAAHDQLTDESQLMQDRYGLVCSILSCEPANNPALAELKQWLMGEFAQDVQRLELPADATTPALEQAQAIGQHMELLADSPALRGKFLVAVAGGFSSGKSSFVSSFMGGEASDLLATGIQPVTAIPTYVMPGEELIIEGHTFKGAHVRLTPEAYGRLTHDFISTMGFNVKEIMPYVVVQSPMPKLEHMAFIDMPGYNPAKSDIADTAADQGIASAALTEADAVIWLLGLDANGTLPQDDLDFLLDHTDGSKPLHVVINKADLRPLESVEQVLQEIRQHLDNAGIAYEGISAYSSTLGEELLHHGKRLADVMQQWDHFSSAAATVHKEFSTLMDGLEAASQTAHRNTEDARSLVHSLKLDMHELLANQEAGGGRPLALEQILGRKMGEDDRVQRLRQAAEDKLARLQKALAGVDWNHAASVLEKTRKRGHELLQQSCGASEPQTAFVHAQWEA